MIKLKPPQWEVFLCDQRFRVLVAGRRFGKTYLALVELCRAAWGPGRLVWYIGPTYRQAKRIFWAALKKMTQPYWACPPNETDLRIELRCGGTICLRGAENYDSLRGDGLDFVVLDEYASMAPQAWTEVLRPALADRQGGRCSSVHRKASIIFTHWSKAPKGGPIGKPSSFTTAEGGNVPRKNWRARRMISTNGLSGRNS